MSLDNYYTLDEKNNVEVNEYRGYSIQPFGNDLKLFYSKPKVEKPCNCPSSASACTRFFYPRMNPYELWHAGTSKDTLFDINNNYVRVFREKQVEKKVIENMIKSGIKLEKGTQLDCVEDKKSGKMKCKVK